MKFLVASILCCFICGHLHGAETHADIQPALDAVYPALVRIHVVSESGNAGRMQKNRGSGSGTIIHPDGYVLTNHHVAGRATRMTIRLADRQECRATLIGTDALSDLAILKIDRSDLRDPNAALPVARFGNSDSLKVGDVVLAMGSPAGLSQSVTKGVVANTEMIAPGGNGLALDGEIVGELVRWIGHDAVIFPGNSGGPLVNLKGEIIGVNEVGIGSIGGAIPANLAKNIADTIIRQGTVKRSTIGLSVQPLLKTSRASSGILVSGATEGSPAAKTGLQAGDVITAINEKSIPAARAPEDIPLFNRIILETPIGSTLTIRGKRQDKDMTWTLLTEEREPMQPREREFLAWGITARNLTKLQAKGMNRSNSDAVVVQSVRSGGPTAAAKPEPPAGSLIIKVNDSPIRNIDDLEKVTSSVTKDAKEPVPALITYEVDGKSYLTVIKIGMEKDEEQAALARKAWLGVSTQVISSDLAEALGIAGQKGMRITGVYPQSQAEKAGLKEGDLLLKIDGEVINASRPEDADVLAETIRQMSISGEITLDVKRNKDSLVIKVPLERSPAATSELQEYQCETLEFSARDVGKEDRLRDKSDDSEKGVLINSVTNAGWAALGGLQNRDILRAVDGKTVESIESLKKIIEEINQTKPTHITFFVRRGITTRLIELEPTW
ncbi:MAG: trypsin-like peptidase domain-containing protein [Akkermansiaceae bacterium]